MWHAGIMPVMINTTVFYYDLHMVSSSLLSSQIFGAVTFSFVGLSE